MTDGKLYAERDGSAREVIRQRAPFGTHPGLWWCPWCDWCSQDTLHSCSHCGAVQNESGVQLGAKGTIPTMELLDTAAIEVVPEPVEKRVATPDRSSTPDTEEVPDVGSMTVGDIRRVLSTLSDTQIALMLDGERRGDKRVTAINAMEDALEEA